jgi:Zn finger protein HypA/HybF involved in hydrogenase expression
MQPIADRRRPTLQDNMPDVYCSECRTWFEPSSVGGWDCPECGRSAVYAYQPCTCPLCQQPRYAVRHGYDVTRVNCDCHLTPEQRRRAAQEAAQHRDREQRQREWAAAAREQEREIAAQRRDAADCLRDRGGVCHEAKPPRAPYPMCAACATNTGAPARSPRQGGRSDWQRVTV